MFWFQCMKNYMRVIIVSIVMLLVLAVSIFILLRHNSRQPEREFNGTFIRGYCHYGYLYQAQKKGNFV